VKTFINLSFVIILHLFIISHSLIAQEENNYGPSSAESVDTTWISHYASGLLPGIAKFSDMVADAEGNVYITGTVRIMGSGEDYITIKYNSAGIEQWIKTYNGPGHSGDNAKSIAVDGSGYVYVTGVSWGIATGPDYATIKYNSDGEEQWITRYNYSNSDINGDYAYDIFLDGTGNIYVTGGSDNGSDADFATVKYDNDGVQQWVARYDGPDSEGEDDANYITVDGSGNVYVTGRSYGLNTSTDYATIKYNNDGVEQWVSRYNGSYNNQDRPHALALDNSGNVYVTGSSVNDLNRTDYLTVKYNSAGVEQWTNRYVGPANSYDDSRALVVDNLGYVYVTGNSYDAVTKDDFTTIKYAPSGEEQWVVRYNSPGDGTDKATVMNIDDDGNIYVGGQSVGSTVVKYTPEGNEVWSASYTDIYDVAAVSLDPSGNIFIAGNNYSDCATIKFNSSGSEDWSIPYSGPALSNERPVKMVLDTYGNIYVAGRSQRPGTNTDYSLLKYNPDGIEQWVAVYDGPESSSDYVTALTVDNSGNIYLTGSSDGTTGSDWATVKYNSEGLEQWVVRFDGTGNSEDIPNAIVVDENNNVYVTGYSSTSSSVYSKDITTIKYNSEGVEQWAALYNGPGDAYDNGVKLALDNQQNVYVTGISKSVSTGYDYSTIKYNSEGVEQWVALYDGPANSDDSPIDLALDSQQNIIVLGQSTGVGTSYDYCTVQYNSEGVEQWEARYSTDGSHQDHPIEMAINSSDEIFVTGYGPGTNSYDNFITIKYSNEGIEQWISEYDGSGYKTDQAAAIAIGSNGYTYVVGRSEGYFESDDYVTVCINSEGYMEYVLRYDDGSDTPVDVVTDGLGHIYVTGYNIYDYGSEVLCTTIKYTDNSATDIKTDTDVLPDFFTLEQNYPNPFNPNTRIKFSIPKTSFITLEVFNSIGEKVGVLVSEELSSGTYLYNWNAAGLASGIYFYQLRATPGGGQAGDASTGSGQSFIQTEKMILLK
jgi:uncharacterized delta-60 repeat protein